MDSWSAGKTQKCPTNSSTSRQSYRCREAGKWARSGSTASRSPNGKEPSAIAQPSRRHSFKPASATQLQRWNPSSPPSSQALLPRSVDRAGCAPRAGLASAACETVALAARCVTEEDALRLRVAKRYVELHGDRFVAPGHAASVLVGLIVRDEIQGYPTCACN